MVERDEWQGQPNPEHTGNGPYAGRLSDSTLVGAPSSDSDHEESEDDDDEDDEVSSSVFSDHDGDDEPTSKRVRLDAGVGLDIGGEPQFIHPAALPSGGEFHDRERRS